MKKLVVVFCCVAVSLSAFSQKKLKTSADSLKHDKRMTQFETMFVQANLEKNRKNYEQALSLYYDCLKLKESDAVYYELARISKAKNNANEAEENIKKALKLSPANKEYARFLKSLR